MTIGLFSSSKPSRPMQRFAAFMFRTQIIPWSKCAIMASIPASLAGITGAAAAWLLGASLAFAATLPDPKALQQVLNDEPRVVEVIEPHLAQGRETRVKYRGWPAVLVLDHLFGSAWREPGTEVEFRALDGYVSRIPSERFRNVPAYLVFDSADHPGRFTVDVPSQNEKNVALGPYYLVWDNIHHRELLADGAVGWPYQVSDVGLTGSSLASLLPGEMAARYADDAAFAERYCLTCHQINGNGGDKWPIDLGRRAKEMTPMEFERWVLTPSAVKPGTTMPPLAENLPEAERQAMAQRLFAYLNALPQAP